MESLARTEKLPTKPQSPQSLTARVAHLFVSEIQIRPKRGVPHSSAFFSEGWEAMKQTPNDASPSFQKESTDLAHFSHQENKNPGRFRPRHNLVQLQIEYPWRRVQAMVTGEPNCPSRSDAGSPFDHVAELKGNRRSSKAADKTVRPTRSCRGPYGQPEA
jgi:hypothetical protein